MLSYLVSTYAGNETKLLIDDLSTELRTVLLMIMLIINSPAQWAIN